MKYTLRVRNTPSGSGLAFCPHEYTLSTLHPQGQVLLFAPTHPQDQVLLFAPTNLILRQPQNMLHFYLKLKRRQAFKSAKSFIGFAVLCHGQRHQKPYCHFDARDN